MIDYSNIQEFEMFCVILNSGRGSDVVKIAKKKGVFGATVFLGRGTVNNRILEYLGLSDVRKEIVLMLAQKEIAYAALDELNKTLKLDKPNHGIAFSTSVNNFIGSRICNSNKLNEGRGVENTMYNSIFVIVDKGKSEEVIDFASKAGSRGGTIINARGSGIHETSKLFSMDIEPEKEIILILSDSSKTDVIVTSLRENLKIDDPGNGIIFVLNLNTTYGLR